MNITKKPIKKCNGCPLNFKRYCGVFEIPRLQWERGKCSGYFNEEMLLSYRASQARLAAKEEARRKRQQVQALRKTEPHYSGHQHTLVASDSPSDRKKSAALHANYVAIGKHTVKMAMVSSILAGKRPRRASPPGLR